VWNKGKNMRLVMAIVVAQFLFQGNALAHRSTTAKAQSAKQTCFSMQGDQKVCFSDGSVTWFFIGVPTD
jgi:hypothetical protein